MPTKTLNEVLTGLVESLQVDLLEPVRPGHPVVARVSSLPDELELIETHDIDFDLTGTLDPFTLTRTQEPATRITKNVQFAGHDPEPPSLEAGPGTDQTLDESVIDRTPLILPTGAFAAVAGTSGVLEQIARLVGGTGVSQVLGTLKGTVGIPVITKRRVTMQVAWSVWEKVSETEERALAEGTDFLAPGGLSGNTASVVMVPRILAEAPTAGDTLTRFLRATVTLTSAGEQVTHTLPDLEVKVPPLVLLLGKLLVPRLVDTGDEPGVPNAAVLDPPLAELKSVTGAFDLVWDAAATGRSGLTLPVKPKWRLTSDPEGNNPLLEGDVPHRAEGLAGPAVSVLLAPKVVRFASGFPRVGGPELDQVYLHVSVQLAGEAPGGQPYPEVAFPAIPLPVPTLRVPTLAAMFNHASFSLATHGGIPPCAVVVYPTSSALAAGTPAAVIEMLSAFHATVARLAGPFPRIPGLGLLSHAVGPLGQLVELLSALHAAATPGEDKGWKLLVRTTDGENDLERIVFYREFLYKQSAEDSLGSMLFVGSPGDGARFFNAEDMKTDEGAFTLRLPTGEDGAFAAVVSSLHGNPPSCQPPEAIPADEIVTPDDGSFGDRLSSFHFL